MVDRRGLIVGLVVSVSLTVVFPPVAAALSFAERLERQFTAADGQGSALAVDLKTGKTIWSHSPDTARIPASVNKLYTTAAALLDLGPHRRLTTTVTVAAGKGNAARSGTLRGGLFIRGGGDPSLSGSDLAALARAVRATGLVTLDGTVVGDDGLFDRIRGVPAQGEGIDPNLEGALGGLVLDHGRLAYATAERFTLELRRAGVKVAKGRTRVGSAPRDGDLLATHHSPTLATLVRLTNTPSDNFYAEMLTKTHGALVRGVGSTSAGIKAAAAALAKIGVRPRRVDGSGIARGNWTTPRTVVRLLSRMSLRPAFTDSLPLAGRTGTLSDRMRRGPAAGRCRAKTGTLSNVSALAGYCPVPGGGSIAFALLNNSTTPDRARKRQDAIVQALAGWHRP